MSITWCCLLLLYVRERNSVALIGIVSYESASKFVVPVLKDCGTTLLRIQRTSRVDATNTPSEPLLLFVVQLAQFNSTCPTKPPAPISSIQSLYFQLIYIYVLLVVLNFDYCCCYCYLPLLLGEQRQFSCCCCCYC